MKTLRSHLIVPVCAAYVLSLHGVGASAGDVDGSFSANPSGIVRTTVMQPDGKAVIGGDFSSISGFTRNCVARLNVDGSVDASFNPDANGNVYSLLMQDDGKILIGGAFTRVGGQARSRVARLNPNGGLDSSFAPGAGFDLIPNCMVLEADGKVLVGGAAGLARLNQDGTVNSSFTPSSNGAVYTVVVQENGKIVIGGSFSVVAGDTRNRLARLNADGSLDSSFNPDVGNFSGGIAFVGAAASQSDGRLLIGGFFQRVGTVARSNFARLNQNGTLDTEFNFSTDWSVSSVAVQANGKIILAGAFRFAGGGNRNSVARANQDGTLDEPFDPDALPTVESACLSKDGKVLIGGNFTTLNGAPRSYLASLMNDTATESLSALTHNRVQWLRGGSGPEIQRSLFEFQTDGSSAWVQLGAGQRMQEGWELTGLNLTGAGNLRARGIVPGGVHNGSSGIVETAGRYSFGFPPEILVSTSPTTEIQNGASKDYGKEFVGGLREVIFAIKNTGSEPLSGIAVTVDGPNASDFSVNGTPVASLPFNAETTFAVRFSPGSAGAKVATLRIASNDADENPFNVGLSGVAVDPAGDDDEDGVSNLAEHNLSALGFDPLIDNSTLRSLLHANANGLGLYRAADMGTLALGAPVLERHAGTGNFILRLGIEQSAGLTNWTPLPGTVDFTITPAGPAPQFFRVLGRKP